MPSISVVIPVKDGGERFGALLEALRRERPDEVLVVDSGSRDGSVERARAAGARVVEIPPEEFGHGRTRNLAAERTTGDLICFLTQDAVPAEGWLDAYRDAFELGERVGAAYGPHLPHPDTSPMIARELTEFFAGFAPDGRPVVQGPGDPLFLSNVNACYRRECWEEIRFPDVPYAEDQAFARAMPAAGWSKVYSPGAAVLHAHDYGPVEFMRRYFDEYRGLRETIDHVEPLSARGVLGLTRRQVAADRRWMAERSLPLGERARWTARSALHHSSRQVFAGLGSRADRLPASVRGAISLEGRDDGAAGREAPPRRAEPLFAEIAELSRRGPEPLADPVPGMSARERLHVAVAIPPFGRGSGGHSSIFQIVHWLERMGHTCSIWVHDPIGIHRTEAAGVLRRRIVSEFVPVRAPVFKGFHDWHGADVAVATGWETVAPLLLLGGTRARAYLVHDHEPEFFATSAERIWAEQTYAHDLYPISSSRWLRRLMRERYGHDGSEFRFGVDQETYLPRQVERSRDTVLFYGRDATARRAVPLGLLALDELKRRRPGLRVVIFGQEKRLPASFPHEHLGIVTPEELARHYSEARVGVCLSLTNYSLIPQEMMACGLPCVDLAGGSPEAEFGADGPVELSAADPIALADSVERLLDDDALWRRRSQAGLEFVRDATWEHAGRQVEVGLRAALADREAAALAAGAQP
ncbi:MAG: glycosyltransferase [Thermoleophilaceae bacterium]|nr:glycosyltransferase [Thermoleophilaceae bacterium]